MVSYIDMLNYAVEHGMIDTVLVQEQVEMQKRKEILEKHPYSIWEGKNGKWYTYLPDSEKDRGKVLKKRNSQKEIEDIVIDFWKKNEEKEKIYLFDDVYFMWRNVQDQLVSENSVARYETDYNRFFKDADFSKMKMKDIDDDSIRIFMCQTIKENNLCKSSAKKLFGYVRNTIITARKKELISGNPVEFMQSKDFYKYCSENFKPDSKKIISDSDMKSLQERFRKDHEEKPNYIPTYAVEFASLTGMRVGEIAALSWDCITDDYIIVCKSEKTNRLSHESYIDKTKNGKIRFFPMTDEIRSLLKSVKQVEEENGYLCEWVFANENGRIHAPMISSCSKTKCRQLGIDEKGIHAYRKTINSKMRCEGVSSTVAAAILGHTKEVNEQYYTFDVTDMEEKSRIVSKINEETVTI